MLAYAVEIARKRKTMKVTTLSQERCVEGNNFLLTRRIILQKGGKNEKKNFS
jgi:hypothetical protein